MEIILKKDSNIKIKNEVNENNSIIKRKEERNIGIDLLRIVSMFMVVILHVLGHGGILNATIPFSFNHNLLWILEIRLQYLQARHLEWDFFLPRILLLSVVTSLCAT